MNEREMELLRMIREHEDPGRALQIAAETIITALGNVRLPEPKETAPGTANTES